MIIHFGTWQLIALVATLSQAVIRSVKDTKPTDRKDRTVGLLATWSIFIVQHGVLFAGGWYTTPQ